MTNDSIAQRAGSFFAKPIGTAMAKRIGICAKTVHAPCSTTYQKSYHTVPCAAILPSSPVFLHTMDTATVRPKNANSMTGVYIAPPNRCMFCMMTSLLSAMCFLLLNPFRNDIGSAIIRYVYDNAKTPRKQ